MDDFAWEFNDYGDEQLIALSLAARLYALQLTMLPSVKHPKGPWFAMLGASDNGKTHLATKLRAFWDTYCAIFDNPISHEKRGQFTIAGRRDSKFVVWPKVANRLRDPASNKSVIIRELAEAPFLVVDDVGADMDTEFGRAMLYNLASEREGKPTVWTSNLYLDGLSQRIDPRFASRIERLGSYCQLDTTPHIQRPKAGG